MKDFSENPYLDLISTLSTQDQKKICKTPFKVFFLF